MANPNEKSGKAKTSDMLNVVGRIEEIVKSTKSSEQTETKLRIVLKSYLSQLTETVNSFFDDYSHTTEEKLQATIKLLDILNEILAYIPRRGDLYLTWLDYASMANLVRTNLAFIGYESAIGRSLSTAGTLSQILLGEIQHIEEIPKMPPSDDPIRYFEYFVPLFNAIQSTFGLYHMLIETLSIINYDDFVDWVNEAVWHYKMLWELCDTVKIKILLGSRKIKNVKNFYNNMLNLGTTLVSSSYIFATVVEKISIFPESIDDYENLTSRTLQGIIDHSHDLLLYLDNIEEEINDCYNRLLVNRNDRLEDADFYSDFKMTRIDLEMTIDLLTFDNTQDHDDIELITRIVDKHEELLDVILDEAGGMEKVLDSFLFGSVMSILKEMLPYVAIKSVAEKSPSSLDEFTFLYRKVIDAAELNEYAEFHLIKILCRLHVDTRLNSDKLELYNYFQELNMLLDGFLLNPRYYIGTNLLLMQCIHLGVGLADINQFENNIRETLQQNFAFSKYAIELEHYLHYLHDQENIDISMLRYRKQHVPLDPLSWIYPDWSKISDLEFIPFSRKKDTILEIAGS